MNDKVRIIYLPLAGVLLLGAALLYRHAGAQRGAPEEAPAPAVSAASTTSTFTYQGYLENGGKAVTDTCDFAFALYESDSGGAPLPGSNLSAPAVAVVDGLFNIPLTFPRSLFNGQILFLEVSVGCPAGNGAGAILGREQLSASPYATGLVPGATLEADQEGNLLTVVNSNTGSANAGAISANASSGAAPAVSAGHEGNGLGLDARSAGGHALHARTQDNDHYGALGLQAPYDVPENSPLFASGGYFAGRNGLIGYTEEAGGWSVVGWHGAPSGTGNYGLYARSESPDSWAAYIYGTGPGVYIRSAPGEIGLRVGNGDLVVDGTKSSVAATDQGDRLLYAEESTELWFSDYGFGQLVDGAAAVALDPLFAQTVDLEQPYHVFVQPYGNAELYVTGRTAAGFQVRSRAGDPDVEFSYRIVAHRAGYGSERLERAPAAPEAVQPSAGGGGQ